MQNYKLNFDGYGINFAVGRHLGERLATLPKPGGILSEEERRILGTLMAAAPELLEAARLASECLPNMFDELRWNGRKEELAEMEAAFAAFQSAIARATQS